jgi:hypothetical protein
MDTLRSQIKNRAFYAVFFVARRGGDLPSSALRGYSVTETAAIATGSEPVAMEENDKLP